MRESLACCSAQPARTPSRTGREERKGAATGDTRYTCCTIHNTVHSAPLTAHDTQYTRHETRAIQPIHPLYEIPAIRYPCHTTRPRYHTPVPSPTMSVLPADVHTALAGLLRGLQAADNVQRAAAEASLNEEWVAQRPDVLLMGLSEQIELAQDTSVRLPCPATPARPHSPLSPRRRAPLPRSSSAACRPRPRRRPRAPPTSS